MTENEKDAIVPWGEDAPSALARRRAEGRSDIQVENRAKAKYLLSLREKFQSDLHVREILHGKAAVEAFDELVRVLSDDPAPGTEDVFREALMELLVELDSMREDEEPGRYLVDQRTGKVVTKLRDQDIIQTQPYEDEHGMMRPGRPAVHPSITVGLALRGAEENRQEKIRALAADSVRGRAYLHLTDPQRIALLAAQRLAKQGMQEDPSLEGDGEVVEFGREQREADLQSVNPSFHRMNMYAAILAIRVFERCGAGGRFRMGEIARRETAKQRWYEVVVTTSGTPELSAPST